MKTWLVMAATLLSAGLANAAPFNTSELDRLNKRLYERTSVVHEKFLPYPATSREGNFYYSDILDAVNTIHFAAEEVVSMQLTLTAYHVPEDDGLTRYNMAYRMMQVCTIAKYTLNELAETNRVAGTKVDVAQLAGAADAVCEELKRLWKSQEKKK